MHERFGVEAGEYRWLPTMSCPSTVRRTSVESGGTTTGCRHGSRFAADGTLVQRASDTCRDRHLGHRARSDGGSTEPAGTAVFSVDRAAASRARRPDRQPAQRLRLIRASELPGWLLRPAKLLVVVIGGSARPIGVAPCRIAWDGPGCQPAPDLADDRANHAAAFGKPTAVKTPLVGPDRDRSAPMRSRRRPRRTLIGVPGRKAASDSTSRSSSASPWCASTLDFSTVADGSKPRGLASAACSVVNRADERRVVLIACRHIDDVLHADEQLGDEYLVADRDFVALDVMEPCRVGSTVWREDNEVAHRSMLSPWRATRNRPFGLSVRRRTSLSAAARGRARARRGSR